ncbi:MAG: ABC transporter permease subunit [Nitriliruptorales bacterium]|nr:ABC transporter permease subunit [Nitriliruptorales bacterium]
MSTGVTDQFPGGALAAWEQGEAQGRRALRQRQARILMFVLLGWLTMLLVWQWGSAQLPGRVLPGPWPVAQEMWEIVASGRFVRHFLTSVTRTFMGFGVAALVGVPVGYAMGRSRYWRAFFHDGVTISGTVPALTYAVMSLIIFGISTIGPVLAVALVSTPYVALNVAEGVRGVDRDLIKMSEAFGRSRREIRRHVLIPTIVPFVYAAVRLSFAVAWKVEALTEVFGGRNGVGFEIRREYQLFNVTGLLAWMFLFIAFMLVIERLLAVSERRLLAWRPQERAGI